MRSGRFTRTLACLVIGYGIVITLTTLFLSHFDGAHFVQAMGIAANLGIVISLLALFHQLRIYNETMKTQERLHFVAMTARFYDIQKLFVGNAGLQDLYSEIYGDHRALAKGCPIDLSSDEVIISSVMFQLMEDVWRMYDLGTSASDAQYQGWLCLFHDWFSSPRLRSAWARLRSYYSTGFDEFVSKTFMNSSWKNTKSVLPRGLQTGDEPGGAF